MRDKICIYQPIANHNSHILLMKKKLLVPGLLLLMGALSLSSCGDDPANGGNGKGHIAPVVGVDTGFLGSELISRAGDEPRKVEDLSLTLKKADGSFEKTWPSVADFDPEEQFPIGEYSIEVAYGDRKAEGFRAEAAYHDSLGIIVREAATTPVELTARRTHALISIRYTDEFEHYIKAGSVNVVTSQKRGITFAYDDENPETRSAVIVPGKTQVTLDIEKYNGTTVEDLEVLEEPLVTVANTHYTITLDVNEGQLGTPVINVTISDDVDVVEVDPIDISDDMLNAPAPTVTIEGIEDGEMIEIVEGAYDNSPIKVQVEAKAKISTITLKANSMYLKTKAKWKAAINANGVDLIEMKDSVARQDIYKDCGLVCHGVWNRPDRLAVIDFTNVPNNIEYLDNDEGLGNNISTFYITAKDQNGKASADTVSFAVKVLPLQFDLSNPSKEHLLFLENEVDVDLEFNGGDPDEMVSFQAEDISWKAVEHKVTEKLGDNLYRVHISDLPKYCPKMRLRAKFNDKTRVIDLTREQVNLATAPGDIDVFAKYAYVSLETSDTTDPAQVAPLVSFWQGSKQLESERIGSTAMFKVNGLTPGQENTITASFVNSYKTTFDALTLNTESDIQLPYSDMEKWDIVAGGTEYWWKSYLGESTKTPWGTMNLVTTSEGGSNTNMFNHNGCAYVARSGTDRTTDKKNGSYAAVVKTIGWGYSDANGGMNAKHVTAGSLHLGSSPTKENEEINYGLSFASRPSALKFWYKYDPRNEKDYGYVEIWLKDSGGNIIAKASSNLTKETAYKEKPLDLNYEANCPKATSICVIFKSSNNPDCLVKSEANLTKPLFGNLSDGNYEGAILYIDDIELVY